MSTDADPSMATTPCTTPTSLSLPHPIVTLPVALIRPYHPSDAPSLAAVANDPLISVHLRNQFPYPYTLDDANSWISTCTAPDSTAQDWALVDPGSGAVMGGVRLGLGDEHDVHACQAELGYWLGSAWWGRRIMPEVVRAVLGWAWEEWDGVAGRRRLERVYASVFDGNARSEGVLRRCGFVCEGRLRRSVVKDGMVRDQLLFAMTREDWGREMGRVRSAEG